jgi:hypothetical protein
MRLHERSQFLFAVVVEDWPPSSAWAASTIFADASIAITS